jgi:hypothetical protein
MKCAQDVFSSSPQYQSSVFQDLTSTTIHGQQSSFIVTMPVYSTIQPLLSNIPVLCNHSHKEQGFQSPTTKPAVPVHSVPNDSVSGLPIVGPITAPVSLTGQSEYNRLHGDIHHNGVAQDGDCVWYCCNCGDGDMGVWQSGCHSCGHGRCGGCSVEEV